MGSDEKDLQASPLARYLPYVLLAAILLWGFSLRAYHIDYPAIGYHNVKESHTLGQALNFYRGDPLLVPRQHYYSLEDPTRGVAGDNFPLVGWVIALGWKVFGPELWVARAVIITFSLGLIVMTYLLVKLLFQREDLALLTALLTAANPVLVFFGRNVQYDIPAVFFMLCAAVAYLQWRKSPRALWFALACWSGALAGMNKWPALIIGVPIALTFPWERLREYRSYWRHYLHALLPAAVVLWWWFYAKSLNPVMAVSLGRDSLGFLGEFFTSRWWSTVYQYAITDNFSRIGLWLALLGACIAFLYVRDFKYRFIAAWCASFVLYGIVFANFLSHHNYYQIPYAPLWAILVAIFLTFLSSPVPKMKLGPLPARTLRWALVLLLFFFVLRAPLRESADRQFATQFQGLDIAGEYIRAHAGPSDIIMDSGHQDRGLLWHADRELVRTLNVSEMLRAEEQRDLRWVFAYQWGIFEPNRLLQIPEIAEHVYANYTLRQFAFALVQQGGQQRLQELYYLYEYGGSSPAREVFLANLSVLLQSRQPESRAYESPFGSTTVYYLTFS
ncbi:glycosyltransferase family 39 protein [Candidatus Woesearchaeota archaeon]|nr:glycosyltransferase family 39 protein [Candidatus Woesearchaeota archaeon]